MRHSREISIHAPRVGSVRSIVPRSCATCRISIHAPRVGSVIKNYGKGAISDDFNPRSPGGERQPTQRHRNAIIQISIHAPRVGSVIISVIAIHQHRHFNPRSPGGERPSGVTSSATKYISIHAPRVGSVSKKAQICFLVLFFITRLFYFYGTSGMPAPAFLYKIHFV